MCRARKYNGEDESECSPTLILMDTHTLKTLLQIGPFVPVLEPGFGSRVVESGQNVPHAKIFLRPAGFDPKTYCLAHGFLVTSPK